MNACLAVVAPDVYKARNTLVSERSLSLIQKLDSFVKREVAREIWFNIQ
jgi:hypothetical protein